jgi:hypothetical protein
MKIKLGGTISYKVQIGPYEPADASAFVEIEDDIDSNNEETEIEALNEKINTILKNQVNKRLEMALSNYKTKVMELKRITTNGK